MNKIFIDFEWHHIDANYPLKGNEIIQIGAVKLDNNNQEIDSFSMYVKPTYVSKISPRINKLTRINDKHLSDAEDFNVVLKAFISWCKKDGDYKIYSWSTCDLSQFKYEIAIKHIKIDADINYIFNHWVDFQACFDDFLGFYNQLSLEKAIDITGLTSVGKAHNALCDALNTAQLCRFIEDDNSSDHINTIKEVLHPTSHNETIGDLCDFSSLFANVN